MSVDRYFQAQFGAEPKVTQFTPGRVNLLGEHIDYNGGMVIPMAIAKGVWIALAPRNDQRVNIASDRFADIVSTPLSDDIAESWAKYAFYACKRAVALGWMETGVDVALTSDLVDGAGLSSSAAVVVGVLKALRALTGATIGDVELAVLARKIENEDLGVPCGIMDQMVVSVASPQIAICLDTQDLSYQALHLPDAYAFPVVHSGARRELSDGRYKARKEECDTAKAVLGTDNLCALNWDDVDVSRLDAHIKRRVRHCITEHQRVVAATTAMSTLGDVVGFAEHMNQSHASMRDDFEMSITAVDTLVSLSRRHGALGARLTGGGFGGCVVSCVPTSHLEAWTKAVQRDAPNTFRVV